MKGCTIVSGAVATVPEPTPDGLRAAALACEGHAEGCVRDAQGWVDQSRKLRAEADRLERTPAWLLKVRRIAQRLFR